LFNQSAFIDFPFIIALAALRSIEVEISLLSVLCSTRLSGTRNLSQMPDYEIFESRMIIAINNISHNNSKQVAAELKDPARH